MTMDLTISITVIIALASILSSPFVAIANNRHAYKIKNLELEHIERMRAIEANQHIQEKELDIYYLNKRNSFVALINKTANFAFHSQLTNYYDDFQSASHEAMLFCSNENQVLIRDFVEFIDSNFGQSFDINTRKEFSKKLNILSESLNKELKSMTASTDSKK